MNETPKSLGVWQMIALHLLPGALITAFFLLTAPAVMHAGFPPAHVYFTGDIVYLDSV
jgi:hypothetical protein